LRRNRTKVLKKNRAFAVGLMYNRDMNDESNTQDNPSTPTEPEGEAEATETEIEEPFGHVVEDVEPELTMAQKLVQELREKHQAGQLPERLALQFSQGFISPIVLADYIGIRPQMVYAAIRDGKLKEYTPELQGNNTQKKVLKVEAAMNWAGAYLTRKQARELAKKLEAEIAENA
jgi:hypothetical protein